MSKHEKAAFLLTVIALLLMGISFCPGGWAEATGILQGLSTGLLSGMVLLLITGIKGKEIKELSDIYDYWVKVNGTLIAADELYSTLYHRTYHGKNDKMTFEEYAGIINNVYWKYNSLGNELAALNYLNICSDRAKAELSEFYNYFFIELRNIHSEIVRAGIEEDKVALNEVREMFFRLQHRMHSLHQTISNIMQEILNQRENIERSFL